MRNLKRALSMLLSSTMVLGMVAMGGSAAGYQDVDDSYNKEAIEVLQAVGIMTGDENGNFAPETTVTRNQMAVIMANLMAYNVASYAGTSPFTDVPSWAEPYVAACWTNGITAGIGDNLYGGDQEVTTAQAALMIMKALGYFQYQSDFGGDWQLSTVTQGNKIDLFNDVDSGVKAAMSRNDVAQLVLNGLEAGMVEADDNTLNVTTPDGTVVEAGRVTYNYVTSGQDYATAIDGVLGVADGATDVSTRGSIVQLGEKLYQGSLKKTETVEADGNYTGMTDVFGRPATRWEYQSEEIGVYTEAADHSFSGKVTAKDLYNAVGATAASTYDWYVSVDDSTPTLHANGLPNLSANKTDTVKEVMDLTLGLANGTGNGVRTEVFVDPVNGYVFLSLTHYYAAEVYTVDEENGMTTLSDLGAGAPGHKLSDEFETTDFEEDQVVAYSYVDGEIQEIFPTTQVEGTVTATRVETENNADSNGDYYIVDSEKYNYNWSVPKTDRLETENVNNNMVGYLDQYGYTIYIDEAAVSYDYAYVLSMGASHDTYGDKDYVWSARMVLTDGTVVSVETDAKNGDLAKHIVSYTVDKNGIYTLSKRSAEDLYNVGSIDVNNGVASFEINGQYYTANSSTVFIVADSAEKVSDYDFSIYTGVKDMPNIDVLANTKATVAVGDGNIAKVVYVQDADVSGVHDVYFVRANVNAKLVSDSELGRYREIAAVVDGEVTTLKVKEGSTAEKILCGGSTNAATALTELANGEGVYLNSNGKDRIIALESISYNADGLVTNVHTYDALNAQMNGYKVDVGGTDKSTKETVELGGYDGAGTRYAWYDDVTVVRWNYYAGEFSVSTINSVKYDENDRTLAVLSENVLNGLCIVEFKDGEDAKVVQPQQKADVVVDMDDDNFVATFGGLNEGETIGNAQVGDPIQIVIKNATLKSRASGDPVTALEAGVQYSVKINGVDYGPYTVNENNELSFSYKLTPADIAANEVVIDGVYTYVEDPDATEFTVTISGDAAGVTVTDKATGAAIASGDKVAKDAVITVTPAEGYTVKVGNETVPAEGKDYPVTGAITITATEDAETPAEISVEIKESVTEGQYDVTVSYTGDVTDEQLIKAINDQFIADGIEGVEVAYIGENGELQDADYVVVGQLNETVNLKVYLNNTASATTVVKGKDAPVGIAAPTGVKYMVEKDKAVTDGASSKTGLYTVNGLGQITVNGKDLTGDLYLVTAYGMAFDSTVSSNPFSYKLPNAEKAVEADGSTANNFYFPAGTEITVTGTDTTNNIRTLTVGTTTVNPTTAVTEANKATASKYTFKLEDGMATDGVFTVKETASSITSVTIGSATIDVPSTNMTSGAITNGFYILKKDAVAAGIATGEYVQLTVTGTGDTAAPVLGVATTIGIEEGTKQIDGKTVAVYNVDGLSSNNLLNGKYTLVPASSKVTFALDKAASSSGTNSLTYTAVYNGMTETKAQLGSGTAAEELYFPVGTKLTVSGATANSRISQSVSTQPTVTVTYADPNKTVAYEAKAPTLDADKNVTNEVTFMLESVLEATDLELATVGASLTSSTTHKAIATAVATDKNFIAVAKNPETALVASQANTVTITLTAKDGYYFAPGAQLTKNSTSDSTNVTDVQTGTVSANGKTVEITITIASTAVS